MKLRVRKLKGGHFVVEVGADATVGDVKAAIQAAQDFEVGKLVHAGKLLRDDAAKLTDKNVKDNDFLVCMPAKKKRTIKKASAPAPAPAAAPAAAAAAATPPSTPAAAPTATPAAATPAPPAPAAVPPAPRADPELASKIAQLAGMGFPESEARRALTLAFGNLPRATQYLLEGIPDSVASQWVGGMPRPGAAPAAAAGAPSTPAASAAAAAAAAAAATPAAAASGGGAAATPAASTADDPLAPLRNHAQFHQLRAVVQSNPAALPLVLQQIGAASPALKTLIDNNMEAFMKLINEPITPSAAAATAAATAPAAATGGGAAAPTGMPNINAAQLLAQLQSMPEAQRNMVAQSLGVTPDQLADVARVMGQMPPEALARMLGGMGGGGAAGGVPPGVHVVRLTADEKAAVDRLVDMGFTRQQAIQAYLACDKDEAMAANLLVSRAFDD